MAAVNSKHGFYRRARLCARRPSDARNIARTGRPTVLMLENNYQSRIDAGDIRAAANQYTQRGYIRMSAQPFADDLSLNRRVSQLPQKILSRR